MKRSRILSLLKLLVLILSAWLLYSEVLVKPRFLDYFRTLARGEMYVSWPWFIAGFVLVVANWGLEIQKWRILISDLERPNWYTASKAVLNGVFVSFFTPNRSGEFVGRVLYIHDKKIEASILTIAGSLAQNICTLLFGGIAAIGFFTDGGLEKTIGVAFFVPLATAVLFLYFNIDRLVLILRRLGLKRKWLHYFFPLRRLEWKRMLNVLVYSALRYLVFSVQFILIFKALGLPLQWMDALQGIWMMFLIQSVIPTIALLEITTRGLAAYYAFNLPPELEPVLLTGSYAVWLINVFLPGLCGAILFLFNRKSDVDL